MDNFDEYCDAMGINEIAVEELRDEIFFRRRKKRVLRMPVFDELGLPQLKVRDYFPPYKPLPEELVKKRTLDHITKILIRENVKELQENGFIEGDKAYAKSTDKAMEQVRKLLEKITPTPYCGRKIYIGVPRASNNELLFAFGPHKNDSYTIFMDLFLFGNKNRLETGDELVPTASSQVKVWVKQQEKDMLDWLVQSLKEKAVDGFPSDKVMLGLIAATDVKKDEYEGKTSLSLNVDDIVFIIGK